MDVQTVNSHNGEIETDIMTKNRWGLKDTHIMVIFPEAIESTVKTVGGFVCDGKWAASDVNDRPGEVELIDLSARLDAQLRAGDIVFDAVEYGGQWYIQRNPQRSAIAARVHDRHCGPSSPWFLHVTPNTNHTKAYDTELEALAVALGYAEECRTLQTERCVRIDGITITPTEIDGRWYLKREPYKGRAPALRRWAAEYYKTHGVYAFFEKESALKKYDTAFHYSKESAFAALELIKFEIEQTTGIETVAHKETEYCNMSTSNEPDKHAGMVSGRLFSNKPNPQQLPKGITFHAYSAADTASDSLEQEEQMNANSSNSSDTDDYDYREDSEDSEDSEDLNIDSTLGILYDIATPALMRGALIAIQREMVEIALPYVRTAMSSFGEIEIKPWQKMLGWISPSIRAKLEIDRQITNLIVSILVPTLLYEAAYRIEWTRKNAAIMGILHSAIDAGFTEAGRLLMEPGLAFVKEHIVSLRRASKEEKDRRKLRAASRNLISSILDGDAESVMEKAKDKVIKLESTTRKR